MKNIVKGGIDSIIALIIIVGLVIALIVAVVLPQVRQTEAIGDAGVGALSNLGDALGGN